MRRTPIVSGISLICLAICHCCAVAGFGDVWTSPDRAISVVPPAAMEPIEVNSSQQAENLAVWVNQDRSLRFIITRAAIPPHVPLIQASVEQGFLKAIQGTLIESKTYKLEGYTILGMSGRGTLADTSVTASQSIFAIDNHVYTVLAMGVGKDVLGDQKAKDFLGSLKILKEMPAGTEEVVLIETLPTWTIPVDLVVRVFGVLVLLFVFVAIILILVRWLASRGTGERQYSWLNIYLVVAIVLGLLGSGGCWENTKMLLRGAGVPVQPAVRLAFAAGLFVAPAVLFLLALLFAWLARRKSKRPARNNVALAVVAAAQDQSRDAKEANSGGTTPFR